MTITPQVLAELQHLDSDWELIPVDDRKRPIDPATGQLKTNWSATTYTADDITTLANTFYSQVLQLREAFPPQDDKGLGGPGPATRATAWQRDDAFADPG